MELLTTDSTSQQTTKIRQREPGEGTRFLGAYMTPDGSYQRQLQHIRDKIQLYTTSLPAIPLDSEGANIALRTVYLPSITYSMSSTFIPTKILEQLQAQVEAKFLSALGYHIHTPNAVAYGPTEFGGLDFPHLQTNRAFNKLPIC